MQIPDIPVGSLLTLLMTTIFGVLILTLIKKILSLRRVVAPHEVHIVQSQKAGRVTYGQLLNSGENSTPPPTMQNTYYEWPTWVPLLGVQVSKLPLTVFDQDLAGYEAYDKDRVPFVVDVKAFYRIADPQLAAERISAMPELRNQLMASLQGAIRSILAKHSIEEIMQGRSEFALQFTEAVNGDLKAWGVETVKSVELMDVYDTDDHKVIESIMAKRVSGIDKESRTEVADNRRAAAEAEIEAERQIELQRQEAARAVGLRAADVTRVTGMEQQKATMAVAEEEKKTIQAQMEVKRETAERAAEIARKVANIDALRDKEVAITAADRDKEVAITAANRDKEVKTTQADADKQVVVLQAQGESERLQQVAEGNLVTATKNAEGVRAIGEAEGAALTAKAMAPVTAELKLQEGIGSNKEYQDFVVRQRQVDATKEVGVAQAAALSAAEIKIIATSGDATSGLTSAASLLSPNGGVRIGTALDAFANTEMGQQILGKMGLGASTKKSAEMVDAATSGVHG